MVYIRESMVCCILLYLIRGFVQLYLRLWSGEKIMYVNEEHPGEDSSKYKGHPKKGRPASWEPYRMRHEPRSSQPYERFVVQKLFVTRVEGASECCLLDPASRHRYGFSGIDPARGIKITEQKEKEEETDLFRTGRVSPCLNRKDNRHRLRLQPLASFAQIEFHRRNSRRIVPCGSLWSSRVMAWTRVMRVSYPNTLVPVN